MRLSTLLLFIILLSIAPLSIKALEIEVKNPSAHERNHQTIEIEWKTVVRKLQLKSGENVLVVDSKGKEYPSQTIYEGKKVAQKLIFQLSLLPKQTLTVSIVKGSPQKYETKTFGRFVPERKDDYAWENDRVAFRMYGPALIKTDGPSNGIDIWCKRTEKPIINIRYEKELSGNGNYHTDWGDGLDFYKVGRTLGAGAMAPLFNDSLILGSNFENQETLDNGPIRTTFRLTYPPFVVNGRSVREIKTISIDAGSQFCKIEEEYIGLPNRSPIAAGIVKRMNSDSVSIDKNRKHITYFEPKTEKDGRIFISVVHQKRWLKFDTRYSHTLAITHYNSKHKTVYYCGYGWSKWGFPTPESWINHIDLFAKNLNLSLIVKIE